MFFGLFGHGCISRIFVILLFIENFWFLFFEFMLFGMFVFGSFPRIFVILPFIEIFCFF